jgi:hypothetical protein
MACVRCGTEAALAASAAPAGAGAASSAKHERLLSPTRYAQVMCLAAPVTAQTLTALAVAARHATELGRALASAQDLTSTLRPADPE